MPQAQGQIQGQAQPMAGQQQNPLQSLTGLMGLAQQFGLGGGQQDFRALTRQALTDARTNQQQFRQPFEVPKAKRPKVKDVFAERDQMQTSLQQRIEQLEQQLAQRARREDRIGAGR